MCSSSASSTSQIKIKLKIFVFCILFVCLYGLRPPFYTQSSYYGAPTSTSSIRYIWSHSFANRRRRRRQHMLFVSSCNDSSSSFISFHLHKSKHENKSNVLGTTIPIKQLRSINVNSTSPYANSQLRNIPIRSNNTNIIFQRQSLGDDRGTSSGSITVTKAKTNRIKLEWIAESVRKLSPLPTSNRNNNATSMVAEIVESIASLGNGRNQHDVVVVGNKIRQLVAVHGAQLLFNHKDVVERIIKACSIVGLVDISMQLLMHLILVEHFIPDSKAYVAVLQCLRKRGQITKMKGVMDALATATATATTATTNSYDGITEESPLVVLDVVAFNLYLAALCEDVQQDGRPTSTLPLLQRLQQAIDLLQPNASLEQFNVRADTYSYNTVLNAISRVQGWNNKSIIIDSIQRWMGNNTDLLAAAGKRIQQTNNNRGSFFSGDVVTINALIRGHMESKDYNSALGLIDKHVLMMGNDNSNNDGGGGGDPVSFTSSSTEIITADRYSVDLAIQPLLQQNRTADVLRLIRNFCKSPEAIDMKSDNLGEVLAAFLTRIAIGAQNPILAEQLLHEMYHHQQQQQQQRQKEEEKDVVDFIPMPPPTTRHYNVIIEGYRRILSRGSRNSYAAAAAELNGDEAIQLWRTMIDRSILPDKYTLTSMIGQYSTPTGIKNIWAESIQQLGMNPTEITCTSLITQLGQVGDGSASCAVFDWMLYCDKNGRMLPRTLKTWNALLAALVSRDFLSQRVHISLPQDMETWLQYNRTKANTTTNNNGTSSRTVAINSILESQASVSNRVNGMTQVDAAKSIFKMMLSSKNNNMNDVHVPSPDSQSFCLIAAALARQADATTPTSSAVGGGGSLISSGMGNASKDSTVDGTGYNLATEAIELFRLSIQEQIPADGRFLNAIIRCFGSDILSAVEAWKREIGRTARQYNKQKKSNGVTTTTTGSNNNSNLMAAYHGLFTVCGRGGRPDIAVRLTYAMKTEGIEPNETALNCYLSGKRRRHKEWILQNGDFPVPALVLLEIQHENILTVECSQYDARDKRKIGDKKVRIIF